MKTERRHELQKNELADTLAQGIDAVRPYGRIIAGVILGLIVLIVAWAYTSNKSAERQAAAWREYFKAFNEFDLDALSEVAEDFSGTTAAIWARLSLADLSLERGTTRLLSDKTAGRQLIERGANAYQSVLSNTGNPMLEQRAHLGLGRSMESLNNLDRARREYQIVVERWPDTAVGLDAKNRLEGLNREPIKRFYDWLAKYEPKRSVSQQPGTPGLKPDFNIDDLDPNDIRLPSAFEEKDKKERAPVTSEPVLPVPGGSTETPASPPEDAESSQPPGDGQAPAEPPATTEPAAEQPPSGSAPPEGQADTK